MSLLARPPSASPQANAGRAQARQAGTTEAVRPRAHGREAISQSIENKGIAALLPPPRESLAMTKKDCRPASKEREKRYSYL